MCFDFCQSFYCVGTVGVVAEALNVVAGGDEPLRATLFEQSFAEDKVPAPRHQYINAVVVLLGRIMLGCTLLGRAWLISTCMGRVCLGCAMLGCTLLRGGAQGNGLVRALLGCTLLGSTLLSLGFFSHNALEPLLYLAVAILPEFQCGLGRKVVGISVGQAEVVFRVEDVFDPHWLFCCISNLCGSLYPARCGLSHSWIPSRFW